MELLIIALTLLFTALLLRESIAARRDRAAIRHVIYVNGTRGKSTVSRLIDAGLRAGGLRVFCKTTGTVPMTIDVNGEEKEIVRRGKSNIREQLQILHRAAAQGAEVLVAECMAITPELQRVSQHRMLKADIGVITNVRLDHTDVMGNTLEEICDSLCSTVPESGEVYTTDEHSFERISRFAQKLGSTAHLSRVSADVPKDIDFAENVALALLVCERLGVDRKTAISGMRGFKRDPFALSVHKLSGGAVFVNGMSINDMQSSEYVWREVCQKYSLSQKRLVLLINSRGDRGCRTEHMIALSKRLCPDEVWLLGAYRRIMRHRLQKADNGPIIREFDSTGKIPLADLDSSTALFAVGNIANYGHSLMQRVKEEGEQLVS